MRFIEKIEKSIPLKIRKQKEERRKRRKERNRIYNTRYRQSKKGSQSIKRRRNKLRMDALTHYGGNPPRCVCCNEDIIEFLCIDHIKGKGCAMRKVDPNQHNIYQWLKSHGYPKGFRVLCHNCNHATQRGKTCPHELMRKVLTQIPILFV